MSQKVLLVTGDGGESYEALYAIHRFLEAGHEPVVAAPKKKRLHLVMHDFEPGWDTYIERPGYQVESNLTFEEVLVDEYAAVIVLGGRAPEYLRNDPKVISLVKDFHQKGKWVCAICHGIQVLISAGILRAAGIPAYVSGSLLQDGWAMSQKLMGLLAVDVQVPRGRLDEARKVLEEAHKAAANAEEEPSVDPESSEEDRGEEDGD